MSAGQFGGAFKKVVRPKDSKKSNSNLNPLNRMSTKRAIVTNDSSSEDSIKSKKKFEDSIIEEDDEDSVSDSDSDMQSKRKKKE